MCKTVIIRGPCWCNGNNGKNINLDEDVRKCLNVLSGGSHDEYELLYKDIEFVKSKCVKCPHLEAEADRLETEARESQRIEVERVEAQRVAEERAAQVAAQGGYEGGYQADNQGGYEGGYQADNQGGYQGGNQGSYQEANRGGHRRVHGGRDRWLVSGIREVTKR
ncbi:hypothetical protein BCON_0031g00470 [Botryotinia convoluta]|uniref:Uncharacterized protein n=1 Tax=Botryotinia convoluta TaxID=54673 RepID=A0A4Z1IHM8_9HELO|nr:hypothetical protein BCON_0031g00470 [Botryotinia convoluta]